MKIIILAIISFFAVGCSSLTNSRIMQTEYGQYTYFKNGEQKPAVILESGLGDNMTSWQLAIENIGQSNQVFTYNRAGYRGSSSIHATRDAQHIVVELKALLHGINVKPPYILVGHSLGGLYMQHYAKSYPDEVLGVVLVDSTHAGKEPECSKIDNNSCPPPDEIPWWASAVLPKAVAGEYKSMPESMAQVRRVSDFPSVPLVVLSRGQNPWRGVNDMQDWQKQRWREAQNNQQDLATLSPISKQIICLTCGHYVHQDQPELINEAIHWILEQRNSKDD